MPIDTAGNRLSQARGITLKSSQSVFKDWVGAGDRDDIYRFSFKQLKSLNLKLHNVQSGVVVELVKDKNKNGRIDSGEVLHRARATSKNAALINRKPLNAGTYFLRVFNRSGNTNYRLVASASLLSAGATTSTTITTLSSNQMTPTGLSNPFLAEVLRLTNQYRQQNGLASLSYDDQLAMAARSHSKNMALQDFFDHTDRDGLSPFQRISATGYRWSIAGENIAAGYSSAAAVVQGWINSPGHRANILNPNYTEIGLGYYYLADDPGTQTWNHYWSQTFGRPMQ